MKEISLCMIVKDEEKVIGRCLDSISDIVDEIIVVDTDIMVTHKKHEIKDINRNLKIFEQMIKDHVEFDDRQEYCYAKELYFLQQILLIRIIIPIFV